MCVTMMLSVIVIVMCSFTDQQGMLKCLSAWSVLLALLVLLPAAAAFASANNQPTGSSILSAAETNINDPPAHRNIVVLCHEVSNDVANGIFDVNNLLKGRVDVLARCVSSALWVSNEIRADTTIYLMLSPHNITVEVRGSRVRSLTPDERTVALYLQRTLWNGGGKDYVDSQRNDTGGREILSSSIDVPTGPGPSAHSCLDDNSEAYTNPQSVPMTEGKTLRDARKGREAMIRRIRVSHRGKASLPGFVLLRDDHLQARLDELASSSSGADDGDEGPIVWMLSETGDPLSELFGRSETRAAVQTCLKHKR
ncbi:hypothetical protein THAOC_10966 [Thalassiosira oceanica]|uniref:Uncharacterized protein n=1 Tax=Thalassiosira oceanica TaxID=159749 RepID=K0TBQ5_THAOC|nr:hypothetical protein THAOC_10966 [Thalassiosira oceanica]|eukprot:EJK67922.1 hypothetical protein THAOC_10966 [Thalassiosira oceanica]